MKRGWGSIRIIILILLAFTLLLTDINVAEIEPVAVIVNKDNPVELLSESDIRKIYTNSILKWPDGKPITLYELAIDNPLRNVFSEKVLGKSPDKVAYEWAHLKITNQAKNPPLTMKNQLLIIKKVSIEMGAIGYVSFSTAKGNTAVKIVSIIQ